MSCRTVLIIAGVIMMLAGATVIYFAVELGRLEKRLIEKTKENTELRNGVERCIEYIAKRDNEIWKADTAVVLLKDGEEKDVTPAKHRAD